MKKYYLLIVCSFACSVVMATNYYVDALNGNNANSGLSVLLAKNTIQAAGNLTNAGDTVFILNGTYAPFSVSRSGTAGAQIVYTNYAGHSPKVKATATTYAVVNLAGSLSYVTINGLEIEGYGTSLSLAADTTPAKNQLVCPVMGSPATAQTPLAKYNGHGITCDGRALMVGAHHLTISNNKVHDCAAAGIGILGADYIIVENNVVYNNSWYTIYGTSGISFNVFFNYDDNTTTYRNIVRNNVSYGNRMYVPFYNDCKVTDGNGIIMDIPKADYNGKSLVVNNIVYNNGGSGIHAFKMNHTDITHNVAYMNAASPEINGGAIYGLNSDDVKVYNNILVSRPGKRINSNTGNTNYVFDYNIYYGGTTVEMVGAHSLIQDPKFVNPSTDPALADFHLQLNSFAINNGDNTHSYPSDKEGSSRPVAGVVDIGAYESVYTGNLNTACNNNLQTKVVGNGNGTGEASAGYLYAPFDTRPANSNQKSRKAINYPAAVLTGIPASSTISSLQFRRAVQVSPANTTPSTQTIPDNSVVNVYVRNEATDNFGSAAFDWTSILPGAANPAVLVYGGEASNLVGSAGGWITVPFQVPFDYTGGNLGVFVEYLQKGNITGATDINWIYDNGGSQPLYNATTYPQMVNAFKFTSTTGTITNSLTTSNERRPVLTVGYCANSLLPVTLQAFGAVKKGSGVYVSWAASNQVNNEGFEVQRAADGSNFIPVGYVRSNAVNGTGSAVQQYAFTDVYPLTGQGYYRLLQKDKDGKGTYSAIVAIFNTSGQLSLTRIYPNPAADKLTAVINASGANTMVTISVQDVQGRTISRFHRQLAMGPNTITIPVSALAGSVYLLQIELPSGEKLINKFIKK